MREVASRTRRRTRAPSYAAPVVLSDTRLRLPVARRELVARERLLRRLPRAGERLPRLVLLSAPAGIERATAFVASLTGKSADTLGKIKSTMYATAVAALTG